MGSMNLHRRMKLFFLGLFVFSVVCPIARAADNPTYEYSQGISKAASNADCPDDWLAAESDIVTIPDPGGTHGLQYDTSGNLIVRTAAKSWQFSSAYVDKPNYKTYSDPDHVNTNASWVTTGNDFTHFYDNQAGGKTGTDFIKLLERSLGMNNDGSHDVIVEYSVDPHNDTIMRPAKNPDIKTYNPDDYGEDPDFLKPGDMTAGVYDNFSRTGVPLGYYRYWKDYAIDQGKFPFSQLGYTYFWGRGNYGEAGELLTLPDVQGLTEFIILENTGVNVYGIYATQSYIYTKNNGQYGNGYANFDITGSCDSVWAGHRFQKNVSRNPASPNRITLASGQTISGGQGILVWSLNYHVTNNGTISGATTNKFGIADTANIAVLFQGDTGTDKGTPIAAGINQLTNSGTITSPGTAVKVAAGNTLITNAGTVDGTTCAIKLMSGTNSITNTGTIGNAATPSSAIEIDAGTTAISNTGAGVIYGNLTLAEEATAALDAGANTLTLSGNGIYTQKSGSTLKIIAHSGGAFGKVETTSDASVNAGSKVHVTVTGYIPNNTTLTNVISGTGAGVNVPGTITSSSPIFTFTGSNGTGDHLSLTAARTHAYNTLASSPDASAVGAALESIGASATGDMAAVLNQLDGMTSASQISETLEQMHLDMSSGNLAGSQAVNSQFLTAVFSRLGYLRSGLADAGIATGDMFQGTGFWLQGLGSHAQQSARKGIEGYQANTFGTSIGADKILNRHVRVGLAAGYGFADINAKTPGSPGTNINSWQGTVYGSFDSLDLGEARENQKYSETAVRNQGRNFYYADGMFAFTQNNYDSRREIFLGAEKRAAKAEHDGQQYSTKLETGYTWVPPMTKALEVTPFASLQYSCLYMNTYKEKGADALSLKVDGQGFNALEQGIGAKFAYPLASKKMGTFIPSVKGAWLYEYFGEKFEATASFAGGGPSFKTSAARPAQHGLLFGTQFAFLNKGNMTLTANWDWALKDRYSSHTYYGTVRFDF